MNTYKKMGEGWGYPSEKIFQALGAFRAAPLRRAIPLSSVVYSEMDWEHRTAAPGEPYEPS